MSVQTYTYDTVRSIELNELPSNLLSRRSEIRWSKRGDRRSSPVATVAKEREKKRRLSFRERIFGQKPRRGNCQSIFHFSFS